MLEEQVKSAGGCLYVCSTPIGNLRDVSLRLLDVLREVDLILCEDTRQTRKLLARYEIPSGERLVSFHEHNEAARVEWLVGQLREGRRVALVTDAGTPIISDPGDAAVAAALEAGVPIVPVPGPSALLAALVASGLPATPFVYLGFPPRSRSDFARFLAPYRHLPATLVMYEAPHRVANLLHWLAEELGDRRAVLAKEITKLHEAFWRGTLAELERRLAEEGARGEYVVVIDNRGAQAEDDAHEREEARFAEAVREVERLMEEGLSHKEAVKRASDAHGVKRRELYNRTLRG
ncbi:16S rRNA (cytidine(1402)-2'-O)-methyltransferase [Alicyclobacillus sendaiensis]|uniref:Ribosomal RNA small subunit methyltransferase I n=1 Tax=Alicyclobacillus sendaiensis PA2 TaxID=3029425 RepID=A0ABT6XZI9_ALISE|nr:16S rRNA (cytidine(1402)-2'-O)-methyltransferase [Alicyclobacillus sendaiensis]MDI9260400.1 16S rRNA (cytidine(1402)-2'-O)-methyltransferase [Alicyclobacillus sendaiensis PA2]